jgi:Uma2 family endonuclease
MVTQKVSPKGRHSRLQIKLGQWFDTWAEPRELASAFTELRTTFGGRSYVPDVAVYRWDRFSGPFGEIVPDEFFEPPDIAVEIVSPEQRVRSLVRGIRACSPGPADQCQSALCDAALADASVDADRLAGAQPDAAR